MVRRRCRQTCQPNGYARMCGLVVRCFERGMETRITQAAKRMASLPAACKRDELGLCLGPYFFEIKRSRPLLLLGPHDVAAKRVGINVELPCIGLFRDRLRFQAWEHDKADLPTKH